ALPHSQRWTGAHAAGFTQRATVPPCVGPRVLRRVGCELGILADHERQPPHLPIEQADDAPEGFLVPEHELRGNRIQVLDWKRGRSPTFPPQLGCSAAAKCCAPAQARSRVPPAYTPPREPRAAFA